MARVSDTPHPEPWGTNPDANWVSRVGGLPDFVNNISHDLHEKRGMPESKAIQEAIGIVKNWASGRGGVSPETRAKAATAVSEWEAKKAASHAKAAAHGIST